MGKLNHKGAKTQRGAKGFFFVKLRVFEPSWFKNYLIKEPLLAVMTLA
jgi:hypothetical protein